jgi:hypothetical protein
MKKKFNEISIIYSKVIILISFTTNLTHSHNTSFKSDSFRSSTSLILLRNENDKIWVVCVSHLISLRIIHSKKIRLIQCFQKLNYRMKYRICHSLIRFCKFTFLLSIGECYRCYSSKWNHRGETQTQLTDTFSHFMHNSLQVVKSSVSN